MQPLIDAAPRRRRQPLHSSMGPTVVPVPAKVSGAIRSYTTHISNIGKGRNQAYISRLTGSHKHFGALAAPLSSKDSLGAALLPQAAAQARRRERGAGSCSCFSACWRAPRPLVAGRLTGACSCSSCSSCSSSRRAARTRRAAARLRGGEAPGESGSSPAAACAGPSTVPAAAGGASPSSAWAAPATCASAGPMEGRAAAPRCCC